MKKMPQKFEMFMYFVIHLLLWVIPGTKPTIRRFYYDHEESADLHLLQNIGPSIMSGTTSCLRIWVCGSACMTTTRSLFFTNLCVTYLILTNVW